MEAPLYRPGAPRTPPAGDESTTSFAEFSELIAGIYDCAFDPSRWTKVVGDLCGALSFDVSIMSVIRLAAGTPTMQVVIGIAPERAAQVMRYQADIVEIWGGAERVMNYPLDEPVIASRVAGPERLREARYVREWCAPQGIGDAIAFAIARTPGMVGNISFSRREPAPPLGDGDIVRLRLIAPHVRRAITISDLFGLKAVEVATFGSVLDSFRFGILLVDRDLGIVHANAAAQAMLAEREPVRLEKGRLALADRATQGALERAVGQAADDAVALGGKGIGIPASGKDNPRVVHVLPLRNGRMRGLAEARAVAALFIAPAAMPARLSSGALAAIYDLTPAETNILELLVAGSTQAEIASRLGIAPSTVKSHLLRLFDKTGCRRQADLLKLAESLSSPV
jgi:DNA-binding CsgD family transcriptional regulator